MDALEGDHVRANTYGGDLPQPGLTSIETTTLVGGGVHTHRRIVWGAIFGGVTSAMSGGVSAAAKPIAQAAGVTPDMVQQQTQAYLQPANPDSAAMSPQDAQKALATNLVTYAKGGPDAAPPPRSGSSASWPRRARSATTRPPSASTTPQAKLKQTRDQAVQTAKTAADDSAAVASKASFGAFGLLLLGGLAAAIGGGTAVQRRRFVTTQREVR